MTTWRSHVSARRCRKSHLAYALHTALHEHVTWLAGENDQILRRPFQAISSLLKAYFQQASEAGIKANKLRFERRFTRLLDQFEELAAQAAEEARGFLANMRDDLIRAKLFLQLPEHRAILNLWVEQSSK